MYEHENPDIRLQQDCAEIVHHLEGSISRIKAVCVMPDTEKAITEFRTELAAILIHCAELLNIEITSAHKKAESF